MECDMNDMEKLEADNTLKIKMRLSEQKRRIQREYSDKKIRQLGRDVQPKSKG